MTLGEAGEFGLILYSDPDALILPSSGPRAVGYRDGKDAVRVQNAILTAGRWV